MLCLALDRTRKRKYFFVPAYLARVLIAPNIPNVWFKLYLELGLLFILEKEGR